MSDIKFKPSMTYVDARRWASNGLLRVSPDDMLILLEMAEEYGAQEAYSQGYRDGQESTVDHWGDNE